MCFLVIRLRFNFLNRRAEKRRKFRPVIARVQACVLSHFCWVWLFVTAGFSVHEIFQARILEWAAMPSSRGSSWPRDWTHISYISCIGKQVLYHSRHLGSRYSESTCCQHDLGSLSESGTQLFRTFLRRRDFSVVDSAFQCMGPGFNPWSGN